MNKAIATLSLSLGITVLTSGWQIAQGLPLKSLPLNKIENVSLDRQRQANPSQTENRAVYWSRTNLSQTKKRTVYRFRTNPNCPNISKDTTQTQG